MPQPGADPARRAEELLRLTQKAAGDLVQGLTTFGFLASPKDEAARHLTREKARHLFIFVTLSVLLEGRKDSAPATARQRRP